MLRPTAFGGYGSTDCFGRWLLLNSSATGCMVGGLSDLTEDIAEVIPDVDSRTSGQYGDGIGSENEERQIELLLDELREQDSRYQEVRREVPYPESAERCDLMLPDGTPVEAKLIRYWRANGDPEPNMYKHVFSPFHKNTLLTDAHSLTDSEIGDRGGLLGLFYKRADDDPENVEALPKRYTAEDIADKIAKDIIHWYDTDVDICRIAHFAGLQHTIHEQGAVISWSVE